MNIISTILQDLGLSDKPLILSPKTLGLRCKGSVLIFKCLVSSRLHGSKSLFCLLYLIGKISLLCKTRIILLNPCYSCVSLSTVKLKPSNFVL